MSDDGCRAVSKSECRMTEDPVCPVCGHREKPEDVAEISWFDRAGDLSSATIECANCETTYYVERWAEFRYCSSRRPT